LPQSGGVVGVCEMDRQQTISKAAFTHGHQPKPTLGVQPAVGGRASSSLCIPQGCKSIPKAILAVGLPGIYVVQFACARYYKADAGQLALSPTDLLFLSPPPSLLCAYLPQFTSPFLLILVSSVVFACSIVH
jgi:hypothetical protein